MPVTAFVASIASISSTICWRAAASCCALEAVASRALSKSTSIPNDRPRGLHNIIFVRPSRRRAMPAQSPRRRLVTILPRSWRGRRRHSGATIWLNFGPCPLLAHSGHAFVRQQCPILGEKRTLPQPVSLESIYWVHALVDRATLNRSVRRVTPAGRDAAAAPAARPCGRETRPRGAARRRRPWHTAAPSPPARRRR